MTLATVGADGRPSTRIVLLKGCDARGIVWYTNYQSRKGRELAANPHAALQFHWVELERVVRIEGRVEQVERGTVRRVLRQPSARFANRRLGVAAERGHRIARGARGQRREVRPEVRAASAAPAALGRLSAGARWLGVLAGPQEPASRPAALSAAGRAAGSASAWRHRTPAPWIRRMVNSTRSGHGQGTRVHERSLQTLLRAAHGGYRRKAARHEGPLCSRAVGASRQAAPDKGLMLRRSPLRADCTAVLAPALPHTMRRAQRTLNFRYVPVAGERFRRSKASPTSSLQPGLEGLAELRQLRGHHCGAIALTRVPGEVVLVIVLGA